MTIAGFDKYHLIKRSVGTGPVAARTYCGRLVVGELIQKKATCLSCRRNRARERARQEREKRV